MNYVGIHREYTKEIFSALHMLLQWTTLNARIMSIYAPKSYYSKSDDAKCTPKPNNIRLWIYPLVESNFILLLIWWENAYVDLNISFGLFGFRYDDIGAIHNCYTSFVWLDPRAAQFDRKMFNLLFGFSSYWIYAVGISSIQWKQIHWYIYMHSNCTSYLRVNAFRIYVVECHQFWPMEKFSVSFIDITQ